MTTTVLTDDLVVEILSRLPLKSFCRFKCVCKSWLSFSSDPHYCQKLPRNPVGVLYQNDEHGTTIHLAGLPSSDKDIDTTLSFVPCYEHPLEFKDCSNGLVLCYHGGTHSEEISDTIVCNPATQEWMTLPKIEPRSAVSFDADLKLCFDPLWSQHFYVFKFESISGGLDTEVKISSDARLAQTRYKTLAGDVHMDILSRLPLKFICRFKCVCKSWRAFSSHPYYREKLPRTPTGLLYRKREHGRLPWSLGTAIHLARLPSSDREIDTTLGFVPSYKYPIQLQDCSNGLLLCYQGGRREEISNAIVCNPATQEWMALPDTEPGPAISNNEFVVCFDTLWTWSQHFYVFKFQSSVVLSPHIGTSTEVKVFFSEDSTWSSCLWETRDVFVGDSLFVNGVLYVKHLFAHKILALDAPDACTQWLNHRIIQLPGFPNRPDMFYCCNGCLGQSSGVLWYAKQELDGCAIRIWSLESPDGWVVKYGRCIWEAHVAPH